MIYLNFQLRTALLDKHHKMLFATYFFPAMASLSSLASLTLPSLSLLGWSPVQSRRDGRAMVEKKTCIWIHKTMMMPCLAKYMYYIVHLLDLFLYLFITNWSFAFDKSISCNKCFMSLPVFKKNMFVQHIVSTQLAPHVERRFRVRVSQGFRVSGRRPKASA